MQANIFEAVGKNGIAFPGPELPVSDEQIQKFHVTHGYVLSNLPQKVLEIYQDQGLGWTAFHEGKPIAAAGVIMAVPGIGSCWGMISAEAKRFPLLLHKNVKKHLEQIILCYKLRRVDYIVDGLNPAAITWAARLGFQFEGEMRAFYPDGHAAQMWSRVSEVR